MRGTIAFLSLVVLLLFSGCDQGPVASFVGPQPESLKALSSVPRELQGQYQSDDQASVIRITDSAVFRDYDYRCQFHKDSLDSTVQIQGNLLKDLQTGMSHPFVKAGDSLSVQVRWSDTLFRISDRNVLKAFKGYYLLNRRVDSGAWEVKALWLSAVQLNIRNIAGAEDLRALRAVTGSPADTTRTLFAPTRRQFKRFIRTQALKGSERFTRIAPVAV